MPSILFRSLSILVGMVIFNGSNLAVVVDALLPTPDLRTTFQTTNYPHRQRQRQRQTPESTITMGMQIKIRIVGRKNGSEKWLEDAYQMYETRLRPSNVQVDTLWHKTDTDLLKHVHADQDKGHTVILLDPAQGQTKTSEQFSKDMYNWLDVGGSRLSFVIGGAPGLPTELLQTTPPHHKLSLSALTFTHQFARTLLVEQIYRATEIRKGSGYHK
mmetsp:Transcript_24342/g.37507  ORF Transcript_24342/g.37507 Transcript_24342/m.37507 type:complete len:215 (-) Transcript_24342:378-1022(-)|eukprot:CAMPEP_0195283738 /NCGR_PEP_ID=MMETSP0707-20130614/2185_1 /TAXON_ID=33640 /ORGANISM="Asterionellopsis glacialis, Strain CCMP134" /LENGTH=214 /DNA_ID=CAMNT_0040342963 /DNA_START=174 /DNA_END=818 /DNA_ORIENTATION=+